MDTKILFLLLISLTSNFVLAQGLDSYFNILWEPREEAVKYFETLNFISKEIVEEEICFSEIMMKDDERITLNFCNETKDTLTDFAIQQKEPELVNRLQEEIKLYEGFELERKYLAGNTSFIYKDQYEQEISFIKLRKLDTYFVLFSGYPRFDEFKFVAEQALNYDESTDIVTILRLILEVKNSSNQLLEDELRKISEFALEENSTIRQFVEERRNDTEYSKLKQVVDEKFISDSLYIKKVLTIVPEVESMGNHFNPNSEENQALIAQMLIDNDLIASLVMFKYLFESLR